MQENNEHLSDDIQQKIELRFLIATSIFVILFSAVIIFRNWSENNDHLDELLTTQGKMALEFDLAIRSYAAESVRPFAEKHVDEGEFIPEVMSTSFVARSVFEKVRKEFPDYIIKFSSDDPRNPANQAGAEELEMIRYFNENPDVTKWSGSIRIEGKEYLACFSARRAEETCMDCHGDPKDAPASLVAQYGSISGFHRPVGEVIALDTVAIPVNTGRSAILGSTVKESIIMILGLCFFIGSIYILLHWLTRKICRQNEVLCSVNEQLKEARSRAEEANAAKSQFLANMSHEIRTPMNSIIGFSDILSEGQLTDDQKRYVEVIKSSGKNLLSLIDDILDISKIEADKIDIELIDFSLIELLKPIESLMKENALKKGIEFKITLSDLLPEYIHTDPTRLNQCLMNLISNAIKFTEQGNVHINISLIENEGMPFVHFEVVDSGIGIPLDKQEIIFHPFDQADGSTTRKFGGTGLGLAITRSLAELMGGSLHLTSREGKGSVFTLMIPTGNGAENRCDSTIHSNHFQDPTVSFS